MLLEEVCFVKDANKKEEMNPFRLSFVLHFMSRKALDKASTPSDMGSQTKVGTFCSCQFYGALSGVSILKDFRIAGSSIGSSNSGGIKDGSSSICINI